jgi:aminoglycoside 2''-phosphotransferase
VGTAAYYARQIGNHYPELEVRTATFNQDGQYNDVLIVNDALVFRFAKVQLAIETLRREVAILRCLQGHVSLAIPQPDYENVETQVVGEAFVGYKIIPGRPLWRDDFSAVTDAQARGRMARQLARFLSELHHLPADALTSVELPHRETRVEWAGMYRRVRQSLFAYMRPDARERVSDHFESYLDDPDRYGFARCLRHGDFGTGNIIYDPRCLSIVGIIDFANVGLGDPAVDFAGLHISYGEAFYRECYSVYPEMARALDRVSFYRGTFALQEALFGVENGDGQAFADGMAAYV